VRELKTTSDEIVGFGPYWARLAIDQQISIYAVAFNASRVVYDVLRKPQLRPSAADRKVCVERNKARGCEDIEPTELDVLEAYGARVSARIADDPEVWHQWREVTFSEHERTEAAYNIFKAVKALRNAERGDLFPMYSGGCRMFGVCEYLDVCTGRADLYDETVFGERGQR